MGLVGWIYRNLLRGAQTRERSDGLSQSVEGPVRVTMTARWAAFAMPLLLACSADKQRSGETGSPAAGVDSAGAPCTPLQALFFDLGETLVTEQDNGLFATMPGVAELLDALDARDPRLPLGVITNVPSSWERADLDALLEEPELLDRFDLVLMSADASAAKPDPVIFTEAAALLVPEADIAHTAFVTEELDHIADDEPATEGARAAGMIGVHLSDAEPSPLAAITLPPSAMEALAEQAWLDCLEALD